MTSCPTEEDLVLFVEGDLGAERADDVAGHLVACDECRRLLGRSEAALRYALGGLADAEAAVPLPRVAPRPGRVLRIAVASAAATAAVVVAAIVLRGSGEDGTTVARLGTTATPAPSRPLTLADEIDALRVRAERLAATPADDRSAGDDADDADVALAALATAEARLDLGMDTGAARLRDVVDRFPGTAAAREARARLVSLGGGR